MFDIAIVGAGELGGELAHQVAVADLARSVRLLDDHGTTAAGKALDITQAAPIERFSTRVSGGTDLHEATAAAVVVIADRATGGEWSGEEGLALLKRICGHSCALLICAGATQRELIERAVRELGLPRARVVGSAPEALASGLRALIALETKHSVRDISATVLGIPPASIVVPWESAAIAGLPALSALDTPAKRRIDARLPQLWPPGPHALASAAKKAIEAIAGRSRQTMSAFIAPDDSAGRRTRAVALPATLCGEGIAAADVPTLTSHDRVALENAMLL